MAGKATLTASPREGTGKGANRKLRAAGSIPAVIYGHGEATRQLVLDAHELDRLFSTVHYENTIINLRIDGERGEVRALVREVQRHPAQAHVLHVDFYQIHADEKLHVSVPIRLIGSAPGVRAGGLLQHAMNDIEVRCLPDRIPESFDVDISRLDIGDSVHVSDLDVPDGVELLADAALSVCSLIPPTVVATTEEAEAAPAVAAATDEEPEVIRRRKEEEEAEG